MNADETKVLKRIIDIAEDIKDGALPSFVPALELEEMIPDLLELQRYIEALETDLDTAHMELDEAEHTYDELYHDYLMLDNEISYYEDQEED